MVSRHASVAAQTAAEHQVQRSLVAAQELGVTSRGLPHLQSTAGVRSATEQATHQKDQAAGLMRAVKDRLSDPADLILVDQSLGRLDELMATGVAGEVKSLATQTARATQEISTQIAAMRDATAQAVGALRSIAVTIQRMNEIATSIAGAVGQQGSATQAIAHAVSQAAAGTAEANSNIAAVGQAVHETGDRASAVLQAATELTQQSAVLTGEVEWFLTAVQHAA